MAEETNPADVGQTPDPAAGSPDAKALQAQLNGTKGRLKQVEASFQAEKETWGLEKQTMGEQLRTAQEAIAALTRARDELTPFQQKATEYEGQLKLAQAQSARQEALMRYPSLLRDGLRELVLSSTLEGDALEAHLRSLGEAYAIQPPDPKKGGSTPPPPPGSGSERKSGKALDEALEAQRKGDFVKFNELMNEHYRLLDKEKGKFVPVERKTAGDLPDKPE